MLDDMNPIQKKIFAIIVLAVIVIAGAAALVFYYPSGEGPEKEDKLVIYAYDSFVSWGLKNATIPEFEKEYGVNVEVRTYGDAGQVLGKAIMEKDNPQADVIIGIDNSLLQKALDNDVFEPYTPENLKNIPKEFDFDPTHHVVPFDYGYVALVYNKSQIQNPPQTFDDLIKPEWKDKIILENPSTSSTGMIFLLWTIAANNNTFNSTCWEKLADNAKAITSGWDSAYEMFSAGEAPVVVSYATDPAYWVEYYNNTNYGAAFLKVNGKYAGYLQIEGMGVVKGCKHPDLAKKFIDFALSEKFQKEIPLTNWMFPVNPNASLPDCFKYAVKPEINLMIPSDVLAENYDNWLNEWKRAVQ
jgi:thiamine transport system substrate-binding protein